MSKKKHLVVCISSTEWKQIQIACNELKIEVDEFVARALEREMSAIFSGQIDK